MTKGAGSDCRFQSVYTRPLCSIEKFSFLVFVERGKNIIMAYVSKEVIHIDFCPTWLPFDGRHVFLKLTEAKTAGLKIPKGKVKHLGELSLYIATRTNILRICVNNMNAVQERIIQAVRPTPPETELLQVSDNDLYSLLLYLDSFLFETHALEQNLSDFFCNTLGLLKIQNPSTKFVALAKQCGYVGDELAKEFLSAVRNRLSHNVAPWVAIWAERRSVAALDFILMFRNICDFRASSSKDYFFVNRDLNSLWSAFQTLLETAEEYLIHEIEKATR